MTERNKHGVLQKVNTKSSVNIQTSPTMTELSFSRITPCSLLQSVDFYLTCPLSEGPSLTGNPREGVGGSSYWCDGIVVNAFPFLCQFVIWMKWHQQNPPDVHFPLTLSYYFLSFFCPLSTDHYLLRVYHEWVTRTRISVCRHRTRVIILARLFKSRFCPCKVF